MSGENKNDIKILTEQVQKEPNNARHVYYLADAYLAADDLHSALRWYQRRASMRSGDYAEVWCALWRIAQITAATNPDEWVAIGQYLRAWEARPGRVEPLGDAVALLMARGHLETARALSARAMAIVASHHCVAPCDIATIESAYTWRIARQHAELTQK